MFSLALVVGVVVLHILLSIRTREKMGLINKVTLAVILEKIKWLGRRIVCIFTLHQWTSAAQEGIPPTQKQLDDGMEGFLDYATMYCKRCKHVSELSKRDKLEYAKTKGYLPKVSK